MWINIKNKKPEEEQNVWYYFDFFKRVYPGKFTREDMSYLYDKPEGTYVSDIFYGESGYLSGDVDWWMPRKEGEEMPIFTM